MTFDLQPSKAPWARSFVSLIVLVLSPIFAFSQAASLPIKYTTGDVPDWVKPVERGGVLASTKVEAQSVRNILRDTQVNVVTPALTTVYTHHAVMPNDASGVAEVSNLSIAFDPSYQSLTLHGVAVVRNGVRVDQLMFAPIAAYPSEPNLRRTIYDGSATLAMRLEDVRIHDVVEYSYSITGTNPILGNLYSAWFALGYGFAVDRVSIRLRSPAGHNFQYKTFESNSVLPAITEMQTGVREYLWLAHNTPAVTADDEIPNHFNPYPRVQVSEYRTWSEVAAWAQPLYANTAQASKGITQLLAQWRNKTLHKKDLAELALNFVQQKIRYDAIEIGVRSHKPAHPQQVLKQGFGDCKDKSQLLVAILRQAGIEAYPALVSQTLRNDVAQQLPSPLAFDHVIVLAIIDEAQYWLDATLEHQNGPLQYRSSAPFEQALVVGSSVKGLVDVVPHPKAKASVQIAETFTFDGAENSALVTIESRHTGQAADRMRTRLAHTPHEKLVLHLLNDYAARFPTAKLVSFSYKDVAEKNEVLIYESYVLPDFSRPEKDAMRLKVHVYGWGAAAHMSLPQVKKRSMPLKMPYPLSIAHTVEIHLSNAQVAQKNESQRIENPHFAFSYAQTSLPNRIVLHYQLETFTAIVTPTFMASYMDDLTTARGYLVQQIEMIPDNVRMHP